MSKDLYCVTVTKRRKPSMKICIASMKNISNSEEKFKQTLAREREGITEPLAAHMEELNFYVEIFNKKKKVVNSL